MSSETNTQNTDITVISMDIENAMSTSVSVYQVLKSSEIKSNISSLLHIINQETYSYILDINNYIRNNVKDASFLKKSLIEKIHGNMGD